MYLPTINEIQKEYILKGVLNNRFVEKKNEATSLLDKS